MVDSATPLPVLLGTTLGHAEVLENVSLSTTQPSSRSITESMWGSCTGPHHDFNRYDRTLDTLMSQPHDAIHCCSMCVSSFLENASGKGISGACVWAAIFITCHQVSILQSYFFSSLTLDVNVSFSRYTSICDVTVTQRSNAGLCASFSLSLFMRSSHGWVSSPGFTFWKILQFRMCHLLLWRSPQLFSQF